MEKRTTPNYKKIYTDLVETKYPYKKEECAFFLNKSHLEFMDVIRLNAILFDDERKETIQLNQKYRSYDESAIFRILSYQKKHQLNNTELANHFKISRNTLRRWKRIFS